MPGHLSVEVSYNRGTPLSLDGLLHGKAYKLDDLVVSLF
jgi:hypothetical protein